MIGDERNINNNNNFVLVCFFCIKITAKTTLESAWKFVLFGGFTGLQAPRLSLQILRSRERDAERQHCSEFVK